MWRGRGGDGRRERACIREGQRERARERESELEKVCVRVRESAVCGRWDEEGQRECE